MTSKEYVNRAISFLHIPNCYVKGGWGQLMTQGEIDRLCKLYERNEQKRSTIKLNTHGFDCVCFLKGLLAGASETYYPTYNDLKNTAVGDCTVAGFGTQLLDKIYEPNENIPLGYALIRGNEHAALSLGDGTYIDANYTTSGQNGIVVHKLERGLFTLAGKIPSIDYEEIMPTVQKDNVHNFLIWLETQYFND